MELERGPYISDPLCLRLEEVEDKAYDLSADVRAWLGVISVGMKEMNCEHRWGRKDEVNSPWECNAE
jgi:hypothetical protein